MLLRADNNLLAMTLAVAECVKLGVSEEYVRTFATEVENMIFTEWNWDDAKEVWQEEARILRRYDFQ